MLFLNTHSYWSVAGNAPFFFKPRKKHLSKETITSYIIFQTPSCIIRCKVIKQQWSWSNFPNSGLNFLSQDSTFHSNHRFLTFTLEGAWSLLFIIIIIFTKKYLEGAQLAIAVFSEALKINKIIYKIVIA